MPNYRIATAYGLMAGKKGRMRANFDFSPFAAAKGYNSEVARRRRAGAVKPARTLPLPELAAHAEK